MHKVTARKDFFCYTLSMTKIDHASKLNWIRAGVLGANDGIVSIAGLVLGIAGASHTISIIFTAGIAGIIAGAISMAAGEYISVSSAKDTEKALLDQEREKLRNNPEAELHALTKIYEEKGLSEKTANAVAHELTLHDAMGAHFDAKLGIDPDNLTNPWHAAIASATAFTVGAVIPLIVIVLSPIRLQIIITFTTVLITLAITGAVSAKFGKSSITKATIRVVTGGALAMAATYGIGIMLHTTTGI